MRHIHKFANIVVLSSIAMTSSLAQALVDNKGTKRIEIDMPKAELSQILSATKAEVSDANIQIFKDGELVRSAKVEIQNRGQTSLKKFSRKNLSVKVDKDHASDQHKKMHIGHVESSKIILSAGPEDGLLLKNKISYALLKLVGISSLETEYAEVILNGKSQGLYMITDNPSDYMTKDKDADVVFRRRYNDDIEIKDAKKEMSQTEIKSAQKQLMNLHRKLTSLKGEQFINEISKQMNLKNYMKWMALNYILKNGDFVDEVYFYGKKQADGTMYFDIAPWDLDDTFSKQMHLEQIPTFPNNAMGSESDKQLIYNYEGRIDLAIAKDPVLLEMYFNEMAEVVTQIDDIALEAIFADVRHDVSVYTQDQDIQKAGLQDPIKAIYNDDYVNKSLNEKLQMIRERRDKVKVELAQINKDSVADRKLRLNAFQMFFIRMNNYLIRYFTK